VALFLYWYGTLAAMLALKYGFKVADFKLIGYEWVSGLGALMLIILGLGFLPFSEFLLSKIPQFLGRISYSVYLIHGTILFALLYLLSKSAPPILILLIYIPTVLLGSALMYRFVEKPAMSFGHRITSSARRTYASTLIAKVN
jgi:peptidoglycan/LPS O-acetylase OafA/YrhL